MRWLVVIGSYRKSLLLPESKSLKRCEVLQSSAVHTRKYKHVIISQIPTIYCISHQDIHPKDPQSDEAPGPSTSSDPMRHNYYFTVKRPPCPVDRRFFDGQSRRCTDICTWALDGRRCGPARPGVPLFGGLQRAESRRVADDLFRVRVEWKGSIGSHEQGIDRFSWTGPWVSPSVRLNGLEFES